MYCVVLITAPDKEEAQKISRKLLEDKLAACVNIIDGAESFFWWEKKIDRARECLLIVKTREDLFTDVEACVKSVHSYRVPEIIALPVVQGSADYLKWIDGSLSENRGKDYS